MIPGIVLSNMMINELVLLAVARGDMTIQSHEAYLSDVKDFFNSDHNFEIADIEHQEKIATVRFKWRPLEKETL
jgi:hypothetical protein